MLILFTPVVMQMQLPKIGSENVNPSIQRGSTESRLVPSIQTESHLLLVKRFEEVKEVIG